MQDARKSLCPQPVRDILGFHLEFLPPGIESYILLFTRSEQKVLHSSPVAEIANMWSPGQNVISHLGGRVSGWVSQGVALALDARLVALHPGDWSKHSRRDDEWGRQTHP